MRKTSTKKKVGAKKIAITFKVENDWRPRKMSNIALDPFLIALIAKIKTLKLRQSIPLSFKQLNEKYNWNEKSVSSSMRHILKKYMPEHNLNYSIHVVKDENKKATQVRILKTI